MFVSWVTIKTEHLDAKGMTDEGRMTVVGTTHATETGKMTECCVERLILFLPPPPTSKHPDP